MQYIFCMNVLEVTCSFKNTLVENLLSQGIGSHAIFMYCKTGGKKKTKQNMFLTWDMPAFSLFCILCTDILFCKRIILTQNFFQCFYIMEVCSVYFPSCFCGISAAHGLIDNNGARSLTSCQPCDVLSF